MEKKAARRASQPVGASGARSKTGGLGSGDGRSRARASSSVRRRIGLEKSTRPARSTDQTGIVPPGYWPWRNRSRSASRRVGSKIEDRRSRQRRRPQQGQSLVFRQAADRPGEVHAARAVHGPDRDRAAGILAVAEQVALGFAARDDGGRSPPVQKRVGGCNAIAGVEVPGERGLRDAAGVVVKADQRIELVRRQRNLHGAQDSGLVAGEVGMEDPERLADPGVEIGGHAARHRGRIGLPGGSRVADAEGPDLFHIKIGSGHESFVPDEGQQAPVGHVHEITGEARGSGSVPRRQGQCAGDGRKPAVERKARSGGSARGE